MLQVKEWFESTSLSLNYGEMMFERGNRLAGKKAMQMAIDLGINPDDLPFKDMSWNETVLLLYLEIQEIKKKLDMK